MTGAYGVSKFYGIARNRHTLETFLTYCQEQGVAHRPVDMAELFAPGFD